MKVFRVKHNISSVLINQGDEVEVTRYFSNIEYANAIFEMLIERIDYSNDEWIALDEVEVGEDVYGEYKVEHEYILRYFSDDTKMGMNFNPENYG